MREAVVGAVAAEVLVVVGAVGGAGASTLSALLARRRAAGRGRVVLVDLDPARGGLDVLLGIEGRPGVRWTDLRHVRGGLRGSDLAGVLPRWDGVEVLSADRHGPPELEPSVLHAVWPALTEDGGCLVVDAPCRSEVPQHPRATILREARTILLTSGDVRGVAGGLVARRMLEDGPVHLALRRRRGGRVAPLEAAHLLGLPLLATVPDDGGVAAATERGFGPRARRGGGLDRAVRRVAVRTARAAAEPGAGDQAYRREVPHG